MIYTVTFNPSLDYIVSVKNFKTGYTNRTEYEQILPGGKGINVSTVLMNLGLESTALGFAAGFTGDEIIRRLEDMGVKAEFIRVEKGISRINLKLISIDGTEINGRGPDISREKIEILMQRLQKLEENDILILAGSIPASASENIYQEIMETLKGRGIRIVVDASGQLLMNVLEYRPFLIKPNHHELGELFHVELHTRKEVIPYGKKLQEMGAENVLVSMAGEGAVLIAENGRIYQSPAPKGDAINTVGAGDSMVAGFLAGWLENGDYEQAFYMGLSAGSASAFSKYLADKAEIMKVYEQFEAYKKDNIYLHF